MKTKQIALNVNTDGCSFVNTLSYFSLFLYLDSRVYSKKHVKKERSRERAELAKAWNLLDPLGKGEFHILHLNAPLEGPGVLVFWDKMPATHLIHILTERVKNGSPRLAYVFGSLVHYGVKTKLKYFKLIVCARFKNKDGTIN